MLKVNPLSREERELLVREYMGQYSKNFSLNQLVKMTSAKPCENALFLRTLMEELRVFGVYEQLDQVIESYLEAQSPEQLFGMVFKRIEKDFCSTLVSFDHFLTTVFFLIPF
jgi:hypothetical protein